MHLDGKILPAHPTNDPPVMLEAVEKRGFPWVSIVVLGVVGMTIATAFGCVLMAIVAAMFGVSGGSLAGTWIQSDEPPSRAAQALLSVGTEIVAEQVYVFSPFGRVTYTFNPNGSSMGGFEKKGTWKMIEDINSAEDEVTVLIQFRDQEPQPMYIRFIDHQNAEFRFPHSYGASYFKVR